jgi:hypothetical protein
MSNEYFILCKECDKYYNKYENHCHKCKTSYKKNLEVHCEICCNNYLKYLVHCCKCQLNYTNDKNHCCDCRLTYEKNEEHCHICKEIYNPLYKKHCEFCCTTYIEFDHHKCSKESIKNSNTIEIKKIKNENIKEDYIEIISQENFSNANKTNNKEEEWIDF